MCFCPSCGRFVHGAHMQDVKDSVEEVNCHNAARIIVSSASNTTCVLIYGHVLVLWRSTSSESLCVKNWQQHPDGMQRVRLHDLRDKNSASSAVAWVDLAHHERHSPDHGALAMLCESGWLLLFNDNGDIAHQQRMFRPDTKQAGCWRPVCTSNNGLLLLTAPNAVYVVQDQDIARAISCCSARTAGLSAAACPLPGSSMPPLAMSSLQSGGLLTEDFTSQILRPASDNLLFAAEEPTMAWLQFPTLRRRPLWDNDDASHSHSMASAALQAATQWAAQSVVGVANAVDGVQGSVIPCSAETTWVIVDDRRMQNLALSPDGLLAACTDNKGRVVLVDSISKTIIRAWKGYRDAQAGWVRWHGKHLGSLAGCSNVEQNQDLKETEANQRHVEMNLVLYAPKREALEIWPARCGRRLHTFRCSQHCKLFQGPKNTDCMLLDDCGRIESVAQILARAAPVPPSRP